MLRLSDCTIWHVLYLLELSEFRTRDPVHTDYVRNLLDTMRPCRENLLAAGESSLRRSNPPKMLEASAATVVVLREDRAFQPPTKPPDPQPKGDDEGEDGDEDPDSASHHGSRRPSAEKRAQVMSMSCADENTENT